MAGKEASVKCGEALTIANAADLHAQLSKALEESSVIELVADSVEKVDTAGLQLLVALSRELEKVDGKMVWKEPSDVLLQAATTLGLTPYLAIDQNA